MRTEQSVSFITRLITVHYPFAARVFLKRAPIVHIEREIFSDAYRTSSLPPSLTHSLTHIVHPESFRSNAQNAIAFARKNRPRVNRSDRLRAFICVRLHAIECVRVRACNRACAYVRAIARTCVRSHLRACEVHLIKDHQIKLCAHVHVYTRTYMYVHIQ